jgi:cell division septum initiation protein DivIVA
MFRRADAGLTKRGPATDVSRPVALPAEVSSRPDVAGALDGLLGTAPCFRTALRGYDRLQVDNYVAWAEGEITAVRRENDDLISRYGQCSAELEISRRLLARSPEGQAMSALSERIGRMLSMAADEAAELTAGATAEADRILADARTDADARLRKAHEIKEMAVQSADQLRQDAERQRAEAEAELQRAREQAERELREAAAQVRREQEQAAATAAAQIAAVQQEIEQLRRRREQAQDSLRHLNDQIGEALQALAGTFPADVQPGVSADVTPNFVVDRAPVASS